MVMIRMELSWRTGRRGSGCEVFRQSVIWRRIQAEDDGWGGESRGRGGSTSSGAEATKYLNHVAMSVDNKRLAGRFWGLANVRMGVRVARCVVVVRRVR
jgi:hypothetical protein